jgi:hypothetical protein
MIKSSLLGVSALGFAAAAAVPAHAQYSPVAAAIGNTIGNMAAAGAEHRCMSGDAMSNKEVGEARTGGEAAMRQYLQLAGTGAAADVRPAFARKPKHQLWSAGGAQGSAAAVRDPLAPRVAAGEAVLAPPTLVRAGDGGSALGVWALVPAGGGQPLAHYDAALRREAGIWKLSRLTLIEGPSAPPAPAQFCHRPGDVEPYVAAVAEREAARARKKAEKAARRAAASSPSARGGS